MTRTRSWATGTLLSCCLLLTYGFAPARADERFPAELLPPTVIAYAEIAHPRQLLTELLQHPLRQRLEASGAYDQAMENPQYVQFRAVVALVELQLGRGWQELLQTATERGVALAVDQSSQGVALLVHAGDPKSLERLRDVALRLANQEAQRRGREAPVRSAEYRGITAYQAGQARFAVCEDYFLLVNNSELGKAIIDRFLDKPGDSLADSALFKEARKSKSDDAAVWAFADIATLRNAGAAPELLGGRADNPASELILGGVLANLHKTDYVSAEMLLKQNRLALAVSAPHDPTWIDETRHYFFGDDGSGRAPPLLWPSQTALSLSAYRDISGMWLRAGDLFNKEVNDQLAQADSGLSTLFSGRDFGEDILGAIQPEIQVVVTRQTFVDDQPQPSIKLPAFALVARLKEPDKMTRELKRIFQSFVGFLNIVGAMNGNPQLDLGEETVDGRMLVTAAFAPEADRPQGDGAIHFNFSSTAPLARELVRLAEQPGEPRDENTIIQTNLTSVREMLEDNRSHLVAQNVLEKGHSREEAEKEIGGLLAVLQEIRDLQIRLTADKQLRLELELNLKDPPKP
jgi:hypothetical protein